MITVEQRKAAAEGVADLLYHSPINATDKTKLRIKRSIDKFILKHGLTEEEIEEAVERVSQ